MKKIVYIVDSFAQVGLDYLKDHAIKTVIGPKKIPNETLKAFGNQIIALVYPDSKFSLELLEQLPNLKIILRCGVGVDNLPLKELTKRGIQVTNTEGINSDAVAEMTVGLMITLSRKILIANTASKIGVKKLYTDEFTGTELRGKTIGLIGYGHIAKKVEYLLAAFGADILIANHTPKEIKYGCQVDLESLIENSDIISLHIPHTKETENLISAQKITKMNSNAIIINTSRGAILDEEALYQALIAKKLGGAALDTVKHEPIDPSNPLLQLDNVIVTPHIGSQTYDTIEKTGLMVAKEIVHFLDTKQAIHPVNSLTKMEMP
ncbi:NAD(P)-dependent oxidoreductase [Liquorilactobacillus mali]|uniref:NAD(P)-dependent oxidoreductase n=1 Tax=Liquorilactobacillus mali TaxID=1618 RepID=UPI002955CA72|nr:NAD(P)-dependent oxidoreductase [Liquorilactobacillus mali]